MAIVKKYAKELYAKEVVMKAAYMFTDCAYLHLDVDTENYLISMQSKTNESEETLLNRFECEMKFQCSEHYARLQHTVKKAIQFLKEKGIECTVYNICKYTGLSSKIVKRELRIMELKIVSLEELEEYI